MKFWKSSPPSTASLTASSKIYRSREEEHYPASLGPRHCVAVSRTCMYPLPRFFATLRGILEQFVIELEFRPPSIIVIRPSDPPLRRCSWIDSPPIGVLVPTFQSIHCYFKFLCRQNSVWLGNSSTPPFRSGRTVKYQSSCLGSISLSSQ